MTSCPSPENLERLLAEALPADLVAAVNSHLRDCTRCQTLLDDLSDSARLKGWSVYAHAPAPLVDEGLAWQRLLRKLETDQENCGESTTLGGDSSLPVLGPAAEAGDLGTLGAYRVQAKLGHGGMGIVFRGYDPALERTVALKVLRPDRADPKARQRLVREAQLAASFRHDNVVHVYAVVDPPDGLPYLVMEYLSGPSLARSLHTDDRLDPWVAAAIMAQVADGLEALHRAGLIHRDVKPGNIILDPATGRAKLTDFGLARRGTLAGSLTQEGILAGTPAYMSPEQARGDESLDARSDLYSLGATLYECLTGEAVFRGTPLMILQQVLHDGPRPPRRLNEAIPRDLETVCLKALAKEPGRRYATARAFAQDLRCVLRGEPIEARQAGALERLCLWGRRKPVVAGLLAALLLTLGAGIGGVISQWRRAEAEFHRAQSELVQAQAERARRRGIRPGARRH
jgi:hypothetical protein